MGLGVQIDALPHTCGTKRGLAVFKQEDDNIDGFCFKCHKFVPNPYGDGEVPDIKTTKKKKTPEQVAAEMAEIDGYQVLDVSHRKLRKSTLDHFGAKVSVSEEDGTTPTAIYWPVKKQGKLTGYHVKIINPPEGSMKAFNVGDVKDPDLIGWDIAKESGAYRLYITEGPEDMASVYQIFKKHGKEEYQPAVVSLPHGASSAKHFISKFAKDIRGRFKEVVFNFDNDDAGDNALKQSLLILPEAKSVLLPFKDANECIVEGVTAAAYKQLAFHTHTPKNTNLVFAPTLHLMAREPAKWGELSWPWPTIQEATRGIRLSETIYIGAGVKMGKGEVRDELVAHFIKEHGVKVLNIGFEENIKQTYKKVASKTVSTIFHDPKKDFDFKAYDKAGEILANNLAVVDIYQVADFNALELDIVAAAEWGAKAVMIDPITNFTNGMPPGEANTFLQGMAQNLSVKARDHNLAMFMFCHLKEPDGDISKDARKAYYEKGRYIGLGNCPHERGGDVNSAQFAGSRGMMRSCHLMMALKGNKDPEIEDVNIKNMRDLEILEAREFGDTAIAHLFWNKDTARFTEISK